MNMLIMYCYRRRTDQLESNVFQNPTNQPIWLSRNPNKRSPTFSLQTYLNRLNDAFDYLARNVYNTKTSYEKAMVAYALSFSSKPEKRVAYDRMKATAVEEINQGTHISVCEIAK